MGRSGKSPAVSATRLRHRRASGVQVSPRLARLRTRGRSPYRSPRRCERIHPPKAAVRCRCRRAAAGSILHPFPGTCGPHDRAEVAGTNSSPTSLTGRESLCASTTTRLAVSRMTVGEPPAGLGATVTGPPRSKRRGELARRSRKLRAVAGGSLPLMMRSGFSHGGDRGPSQSAVGAPCDDCSILTSREAVGFSTRWSNSMGISSSNMDARASDMGRS